MGILSPWIEMRSFGSPVEVEAEARPTRFFLEAFTDGRTLVGSLPHPLENKKNCLLAVLFVYGAGDGNTQPLD